jgi:hypothetical protein
LDYLRARYLNFNAGRFYGRDPLEGKSVNPWLGNSYHYGGNNPVWARDPSGRVTLVEQMTVVQILSTIQVNHARIEFTVLRDTILLTRQYLVPATQQQNIGLKLIMAGVPSGYEFYRRGRLLASEGFRRISAELAGAYVKQGEKLKELSQLLQPVKQKVENGEEDETLKDKRDHFVEVLDETIKWADALGFLYETGGNRATAEKIQNATNWGRSLSEVLQETTDEELEVFEKYLNLLFEVLGD